MAGVSRSITRSWILFFYLLNVCFLFIFTQRQSGLLSARNIFSPFYPFFIYIMQRLNFSRYLHENNNRVIFGGRFVSRSTIMATQQRHLLLIIFLFLFISRGHGLRGSFSFQSTERSVFIPKMMACVVREGRFLSPAADDDVAKVRPNIFILFGARAERKSL
jgi:hypothetical protein